MKMKGIKVFKPNQETHKEFKEVLQSAEKAGVKVIAMDTIVAPSILQIDEEVEIDLT